ncbi:hypothetical protein C8F01DRAFT_1119171 [Mycena amicta]|nr:hypothetical protein C8F01DRAFT_1119171 [Mycena amicta]
MFHYYDEATEGPDSIRARLSPALDIIASGIPCVVWGEDALAYMFFVPNGLHALNLLVPDDQVTNSAIAVERGGEYTIMDPNEDDYNREKALRSQDRPHLFPNSVSLKKIQFDVGVSEEPPTVTIHPTSFWRFDIDDPSRSTPLIPSVGAAYDPLRYPTGIALVDSLIETRLEPPTHNGLSIHRLDERIACWLNHLMLYYFSDEEGAKRDSAGEFLPRLGEVVNGIKEENRPHFERYYTVGSRDVHHEKCQILVGSRRCDEM